MISKRPNVVQRIMQKFGSTRIGAWILRGTLHHLDSTSLWMTGGRRSLGGLLGAMPVITLTTTGAKSGLSRSTPLAGYEDGEDIVLIASNFGQKHHPAWYHNLKANPETTATRDNVTLTYIAREAEGSERDRYWKLAASNNVAYDAYLGRTGGRKIPVMVLSPKPD